MVEQGRLNYSAARRRPRRPISERLANAAAGNAPFKLPEYWLDIIGRLEQFIAELC
jgi:hypothetical protein